MKTSLLISTATSLLLTVTSATAANHTGFGGPSSTTDATASSDWTGFYIGGSVGAATDGSFTVIIEPDETAFDANSHAPIGAFFGYQSQTDQFVIGAEYAVSAATAVTFEDGTNEFVAAYGDLKVRAGYAAGPALFYGVAGVSAIVFDNDGNNTLDGVGFGYGVGADYAVSPNFFVGAEYFARATEGDIFAGDLGTTSDGEIDVATITFRAAYKF